jgi:hypothetical protein
LQHALHACPTLKIRSSLKWEIRRFDTLLYDLSVDPSQELPISDPCVEKMMIDHLVRLMHENDSPAEQYERLGLGNMAGE